MAEDSQQHRRAAAPSLARGPGGDRRARRRPQAVGDCERRFTFGRHASHFTDGLANTCTHMQLAIASLGLGSHWGTVHVQEPLKRVLGVPDLIDVYLIISVG